MSDDFDFIVQSTVDITEQYNINLGGLDQDIAQEIIDSQPFIQQTRERMEARRLRPDIVLANVDYGLIDMKEWAQAVADDFWTAYHSGDVMAVDGTHAIPYQRHLTQQIYACAIAGLTSLNPVKPLTKMVKTKADLNIDDDVVRVVDQSGQFTKSLSWPIAYMEYQERLYALESSVGHIYLDGNLMPQNLITRNAGRQLFNDMLGRSKSKVYVGVVKNISMGDAERRWIARALRPGELFVQDTLRRFMHRDERTEYGGAVDTLLDRVGDHILRGVYRPGNKTFGFECHRDDLRFVIGMLWLDCNNTPMREIPFLLDQVDSMLRGEFRPGDAQSIIQSLLMEAGHESYIDELNERELR